MNVLNTLFHRWKKKQADSDPLKKYHLWYPKPDTNLYELRNGEAPPNNERPQHLKHKNLDIDLGNLVEKIMRVAKDMDVKDSHDVSIAIGKIVGVQLPAFSATHVPKKIAITEKSRLYRPSPSQVLGLSK